MEIKDKYGRTFETLRISLTNACNLSCSYCVEAGSEDLPKTKLHSSESFLAEQKTLSYQQLFDVVKKLTEYLPIKTIRLTGGEPLLYKKLPSLVALLSDLDVKLKLTTNGVLLSNFLKTVSIDKIESVNISIDALDPHIFQKITKKNNVSKVIEGIKSAVQKGLKVKLNCVVMKNQNESEIIPLLDFARELGISIRFLEVMNMGHLFQQAESQFVSQQEILDIISSKYQVFAESREVSATASYWKTPLGHVFGIIANESNPFCHDCNRLRLDSYGNIFGCLSNEKGISLFPFIDEKDKVATLLHEALGQKQAVKFKGSAMSMIAIGG